MEQNDHVFTIQLVGEDGVGKKTFANKLLQRAGTEERVGADNLVDLTQCVSMPAPYSAVHMYIVDGNEYFEKIDRQFDLTILVVNRHIPLASRFILVHLLQKKQPVIILVTHSESAIRGIKDCYEVRHFIAAFLSTLFSTTALNYETAKRSYISSRSSANGFLASAIFPK
jgi:hypothetical protein